MAVAMAAVGLDFRPYMRSRDAAERLVEVAVAEGVAERVQRDREVERKNLANEVSGNVGNIVGRHMSAALQNIARAMRPS